MATGAKTVGKTMVNLSSQNPCPMMVRKASRSLHKKLLPMFPQFVYSTTERRSTIVFPVSIFFAFDTADRNRYHQLFSRGYSQDATAPASRLVKGHFSLSAAPAGAGAVCRG
jgi:hypothetical protein